MSIVPSLLLILIPLLAGVAVLSSGNAVAKPIALGASLLTLAVFVSILAAFAPTAELQFVYEQPWIQWLNITLKIGIDGISLIPLLLTAGLVPLIILSVRPADYSRHSTLFGLILLMQAGLATVFLARSAFLFYLGWEAALIPIFFISGIFGGEQRAQITLKFFIYTVAGSLCMLLALVYLYSQTTAVARDDFDMLAAAGRALDAPTQGWVFAGLFIAFAIKMPVFPFHTWQPDTYTNAPAPGAMLLSGIMLKMGVYGVLRWLLPVVPLGVASHQNIVLWLGVIGVVYGSVIAIKQSDIKRVVAYSSFAHVGLMAAAMFTLTAPGITGTLAQMLSHGLTVVGLFLVVHHVEKSLGRRDVGSLGGLAKEAPAFAIYFMVILLGSVALPLTSGFIGEFLMLLGVFKFNTTLGVVAGLTVILSAVYMLRIFQATLLGPKVDGISALRPLVLAEHLVFSVLVLAILVLGVYPKPILALVEPSVTLLVQQAQAIR